uniref:Zinc finger, CCHC-type n=1 Tax=Tanacetum cinerariifolium TaxID=118510 RepID=A0A699GMN0_TANCI|nr:zinc finger, CCHC-type [Tanacetum cinerariifolium]
MALNFSKLEKFEGVDFRRWQKKIHFLLSSMSMVYVLTTPKPEDGGENPIVEQVRRRPKWDNNDYVCRGLILNGMFGSLFDVNQNVETSKELWDTLEAKYMEEDASSKKFLVSCIIDKLPPSWKDFKHTLKHLKEELTLIELGSHPRIKESLRVHDSDKPKGNNVSGPSVVNMVKHNNSFRYSGNKGKQKHHDTKADPNKKPKVTCWKCEKPGHLKRDCKGGNVGKKANGSGTKGSGDSSFNPLKDAGLRPIKSASTPMETHKPLSNDAAGTYVDVHLYRSMIGSLMYLTSSRLDIMFDVRACLRFQIQPKVYHMHAVKRIFRHLKGQPTLDLWYPKDSPLELIAYFDSDYVGVSLDRKSTTGGCQHVLWFQNQLLDYGYNFMQTKIHMDSESAICVVKNPVYHSNTKQIEIRHHFIRDSNNKRLIEMVKIYTNYNVADLLTKAFDVTRF